MSAKFLTLVVCFVHVISVAHAKPFLGEPQPEDTQAEPEAPPPKSFENDRLSITPIEGEPRDLEEYSRRFSKADYFHPYRQALSIRAGVVFGLRDSSDEDDLMNGLIGFNY